MGLSQLLNNADSPEQLHIAQHNSTGTNLYSNGNSVNLLRKHQFKTNVQNRALALLN